MDYDIVFCSQALQDLSRLDRVIAKRIVAKIERMRHDLHGDVKRLKNFQPGHRLRVGDYRVLFDVRGSQAIIQYIRHRREAYTG